MDIDAFPPIAIESSLKSTGGTVDDTGVSAQETLAGEQN
jgi:hypothetical protein